MKFRLSRILRSSLAVKTSFLKRLLPFLILFFSVFIANAQIVYTDVIPDYTPTLIYNLDLNNDGISDFLIAINSSWGCVGPNYYIKISPQNGSKCSVQKLEAGVVIGSSLSYSAAENQSMVKTYTTGGRYCFSYYIGTWYSAVNGYLALELIDSGKTYYGWARLDTYGAASFTIKDYAYNSNPDSSILAGQTCPPQAHITPTGPTTFCAGDSVLLFSSNSGSNLSYKWKLDGNSISGATNQSFTAKTAGKYKVKVTDNTNNCSTLSDKVKVTVPCRMNHGSGMIGDNNKLKVYPNPFSNSTTISFSLPQSQNVSLNIYDVTGRLFTNLLDETISEGSHQLQWNAEDENGNAVSDGIYFLTMQTTGQTETIRLSVIK